MPFLGVSPTQEFTSVAKQSITGDGSTSYTLNKGVSTENDLAVFVNDVRQEPGVAYTASANTITFTANLESTDSCYVLHIGRTFSSAESPGITDLAQEKVVTITTDGHIVPTANVTYDLGTSDLRFRDLYLSGSSLHLGAHDITANATHVSMGNVATTGVMSGNAALMTSLNADELTSGTLPLARLPDDVTIVNDLTIGGDFVVNGNTTTIAANELKVEDSLIQLATNNEISDTLDIGFVGHYSNDGGTTALHTGFFRDASDEQYYLFNGYEDDTFDTATPPSTIDRTANTFSLADLNVGGLNATTSVEATTAFRAYDSVGAAYRNVLRYSGGNVRIETGSSGTEKIGLFAGGSEYLTIDSSGNVGIGYNAPTAPLHFYKPDARFLLQGNGTSARTRIQFLPRDASNVATLQEIEGIENNLIFLTGGSSGNSYVPTERMRIDAGGSVLIGKTTPTDLHNTWNHLIIGEKGAVISQNGAGGIAGIFVADNIYIDDATGTYAYQESAAASFIRQTGGEITFNNAASGTAGAAAALTERVRIDSAGNVGIGTNSPSSYNSIMDDLVIARSGDSGITLVSGTTSEGSIAFADGTSGADTYRGWINYNHNSNFLRFATNASVRMYIDSAGKIGVGNQNPSGSFHLTTVDASGSDVYYVAQNTTASRIAGYRILDESNNVGGVFQYDNGGNQLLIGTTQASDFLFTTSNTERMRIDSSGYLLVGQTSAYSGTGTTIGPNGEISNATASGVASSLNLAGIIGVSNGFQITTNTSNQHEYTFLNGGSVAVKIDTSGNVGIGSGASGSLSTALEVSGDSSGVTNNITTYNANTASSAEASVDWALERTGSAVKMRSARISSGKYGTWTTTPSTVDGYLRFLTVQDESLVERMRVDYDGLKFNGDTAAANALDDYEEGTFTPSFTTSGTLTVNSATYTKIGRQVTCRFYLSASTTCSGDITGLPFTPNGESAGVVGYQNHVSGETIGILVQAANVWNLRIGSTQYGLTAGKQIRGMFTYFTDA